MSAQHDREHTAREIARGLREAVAGALASGVRLPWDAARDVARLVGLEGLERALAACEPHAAAPRPREVEHLRARLQRLAEASAESGTLAAFFAADRELQAFGDKIATLEWEAVPRSRAPGHDPEGGPPPAPTLTLDAGEALADLVPAASLAATRVTAPVAGALRAACDWLGLDAHRVYSLNVSGGALAMVVQPANPAGLGPAADVLGSVDGHLGAGPGRGWTLRVPVVATRPTFLMVEQGPLPLALPWHAIVRLRMLGAAEAPPAEADVLAPLATGERTARERPAALIAHGRRRAWLVADRLVWRLAAEPDAPESAPPLEGLTRTVRAEDGTAYWVVDPSWLLRGVAPPAFPEVREHAPMPEAPPEGRRASLAAVDVTAGHPSGGARTLTIADVTPIAADHPSGGAPPVAAEIAAPEPPPAVEEARPEATTWAIEPPSEEPVRTALVAEDSLVARIYLQRLLEEHGFEVTAVATAADLWQELSAQPWRLVCADVQLPDAGGLPHLRALLDGAPPAGWSAAKDARFTLVVLTRDADDDAVASTAGAELRLRKPIDEDALARLLASQGLLEAEEGA